MADKKYYWLKLKRDFFKRHDIQIIENMPNGKDYVLFYMKLLVESVDHDGALRFSDTIPYNEQMLSTITNTNIDAVRSAMKVFTELNMIDILDDRTIFMNEINGLLGSETYWAEKKRRQRLGHLQDNVLPASSLSKVELERDIEKESESNSGGLLTESEMDAARERQKLNDECYDLAESIGLKSSSDRMKCDGCVADYSAEWLIEALKRTANATPDKRNWNYIIKGMLDKWKAAGRIDDGQKPKANVPRRIE